MPTITLLIDYNEAQLTSSHFHFLRMEHIDDVEGLPILDGDIDFERFIDGDEDRFRFNDENQWKALAQSHGTQKKLRFVECLFLLWRERRNQNCPMAPLAERHIVEYQPDELNK